jgi:hypothetical protein
MSKIWRTATLFVSVAPGQRSSGREHGGTQSTERLTLSRLPCKLAHPLVCRPSTSETLTRTPQSSHRTSNVTVPSRPPRVLALRNLCSRSPEPPPAPTWRLTGARSSLTATKIKRSRPSFTSSWETTSRLTKWKVTRGRTSCSLSRLLRRRMRCRSEAHTSTGVRRCTSQMTALCTVVPLSSVRPSSHPLPPW